MKKFDVCLMNPPYGSTGGDTLHLKFVDKCLDIANKQIVIMPFSFVTKVNHKPSKKYKEKFSPYLSEVEEVDSKLFVGTSMPNVGIYIFGDKTNNIDIKYINSPNELLSSLLNKSEFTEYEKEIVKYLDNDNFILKENKFIFAKKGGGHSHVTKQSLARKGITDEFEVNKLIEKNILHKIKHIPINKTYLITNFALGGKGNINFMSSKTGQIFNDYTSFKNYIINRNTTGSCNILMFNSVKAAENCKQALQRPLLQFTLLRTQDDQNITIKKCYKYIPVINWEDTRVKTDEGLLEVCGCPKDKCKEYADYCRKVIVKNINR